MDDRRLTLSARTRSKVSLGEELSALQEGRGGDDDFKKVFYRYARPLNSFFARRGLSESERQDLVQETFLAVHKDLKSLENLDQFEGWIFGIAANLFRNRIRRARAQKRQVSEVSLEAAPEAATIPEPHPPLAPSGLQLVLTTERLELLQRALEKLPSKMRTCVVLRLQKDMKYQEISDATGVTLNTVRSHLSQARKRLKRELADHFDGFEPEW